MSQLLAAVAALGCRRPKAGARSSGIPAAGIAAKAARGTSCDTNVIEWMLPDEAAASAAVSGKPRLVFPASTLCRKGAFELREALRGLPVELAVTGGVLEGADFWDGIEMVMPEGRNGLDRATAVVLPAFVEHQPRPLLRAIARGIPVITTSACGVTGLPGVTEVAAGDAQALRAAIEALCFANPPRRV